MSVHHSYQHMYVTYYFILGRSCLDVTHAFSLSILYIRTLKPRVVTLLRSHNYMVGKLGPEVILLFFLIIIITIIIILSVFSHN